MKKFALVGLAGLTVAALTGFTVSPHEKPSSPSHDLVGVRVLMSNDDSMNTGAPAGDTRGLYEARKALCAAGADVVVIAPWANQSGVGSGVTNGGTFTVSERTALPAGYENDCAGAPSHGRVFGVCRGSTPCGPTSATATPADTVKFALRGGLATLVGWSHEPDLVVSGMNAGPNVASSVNESGTVGATIAAIDDGVPAVALNAMVNPKHPRYDVAMETYVDGARWSAQFITDLYHRGLLSPNYVVNVNYPNTADGLKPQGVTWTRMGLGTAGLHTYTRQGESLTFTVNLGGCPGSEYCTAETRKDADMAAVFGGKIAITALTRDRTVLTNSANKLESFVNSGKAGK